MKNSGASIYHTSMQIDAYLAIKYNCHKLLDDWTCFLKGDLMKKYCKQMYSIFYFFFLNKEVLSFIDLNGR